MSEKCKAANERKNALTGELLQLLPVGRENAVGRRALAARLQIGDRSVRKLIEDLRDQGILVCNDQDGRGYYIAASTDEVERQYRIDRARALAVMRRMKTARMLLQAAGRAVE